MKDLNKLRTEDRAVHDWYRFVLSFPPHLVRDYLERFDVRPFHTVLDPFCGTGTTTVECKKLGIGSIGIEPNPMAYFASSVKVDWDVDYKELLEYAEEVALSTKKTLDENGFGEWEDLPLFAENGNSKTVLKQLPDERSKILLKNSISPRPLHKALVLLDAIDRQGDPHFQRYGRLSLANALVNRISNLKFGPEVGVGKIKDDAPVVEAWLECIRTTVRDIRRYRGRARIGSRIIHADARSVEDILKPGSVDFVITSPPYPNEKDYTRTTRLESVILGLIKNRHELRMLKQNLVRSNTRGVYKADTDDREIADNSTIRNLADEIEKRRIALGKTSGFERQYSRVTLLYFGGMAKHLASLRPALKPGARLAYVVGDQASYLRVMIRTGELLAGIAKSQGYNVTGIDLFRTRPSTVTGEQLREEVVTLEWPGD
ncbi:MAG: DNA methyltransferase [Gemmatimonadota bacterium]|nr:DNA methyltransferase [Gemmatimonadota bacterium]